MWLQALMRCLPPSALVAASAAIAVVPVEAQVPIDYPVVGVTPPGDCDHAPDINAIDGYSAARGAHDFWIYPILQGDISGARFGVSWPSEWTLLEAELCFGSLLQGELESPGVHGITLGIPPDQVASRASIRYRIETSTDGLLRLIPHAETNDLAYRLPDGTWMHYYGDGFIDYYVMIGEIDICTNVRPIYRPADWCSLIGGSPIYPGWISLPSTLSLPAGVTFSDTLSGWSGECQGGLECGPQLTYPCIEGASSEAGWLHFENLDWEPGPIRLLMMVDTVGLKPGRYTTRVMTSGCGTCGVICDQVMLSVTPLAVQPATWGQIKARHRD